MLGAALLARNAVEMGLASKPWVKTSMAPGSQVVSDYYDQAGLWPYLEKLGFFLVGYACTTCIGNTGPLPEEISKAITTTTCRSPRCSREPQLRGPHPPDVKMNYLASPPLVIAYALAGTWISTSRRSRSAQIGKAKRSISATFGRRRKRSRTPSPRRSARRCSSRTMPMCSRATNAGGTCPPRTATRSTGIRSRPTCASRRTSTACRPSRRLSATSPGPGCWRYWAIR